MNARVDLFPDEKKVSPSQFFAGGKDMAETYAMTDGVTEEQFDAASISGHSVAVAHRSSRVIGSVSLLVSTTGLCQERLAKPMSAPPRPVLVSVPAIATSGVT